MGEWDEAALRPVLPGTALLFSAFVPELQAVRRPNTWRSAFDDEVCSEEESRQKSGGRGVVVRDVDTGPAGAGSGVRPGAADAFRAVQHGGGVQLPEREVHERPPVGEAHEGEMGEGDRRRNA